MSGQPPPPPLQRLLDELSRNGENLHTPFASPFAPPFASPFAPPFASPFASPFAAFPLPYFPFAMDSQENEEEQIRKALEASVVERGVEVDHESYAKALEESSKEYQAHLDQLGKAEETTGASSPDGNPSSTPTVLDAASNDSEDESLIQYAIALSQGLAVDDSERPSSTTTAEQQLSQQLPSSSSSSDASPSSPSSPSSHPPPFSSPLTRSPEPICSTASAPPASSRPPSTSPVPVDSKELERQRTVFEQNLEFQRTLEIDRARLETGRLIEQAQQERQSQLDAITASTFPEEPPASAETCTIAVRLPNSSRIMRTWSLDTELDIVVRWVSSKLIATGKLLLPTEFILATGFPNARKLIDNAPLRELNIGNRILLSVDLCND